MRRAQAIVEKNRASKKKRFSITFSNPFRRGSSSSYDGRR